MMEPLTACSTAAASRAALDAPSIDKEHLHTAVGTGRRRFADKPLDGDMIQFILYRQESRGKFLAVDCIYRGLQAVIPWGMQLLLAVLQKPDGNLRMRQCNVIQYPRHGFCFGHIAL